MVADEGGFDKRRCRSHSVNTNDKKIPLADNNAAGRARRSFEEEGEAESLRPMIGWSGAASLHRSFDPCQQSGRSLRHPVGGSD